MNYPAEFKGRESIATVLAKYKNTTFLNNPSHKEFLEKKSWNDLTNRKVAGRITSRRDHGNNIFLDLFDQTGEIQLHLKPSQAHRIKVGDMVGVSGTLGANPRGNALLVISELILLAPTRYRAPDKAQGITDPETIYRHRERDLAFSADSRAVFIKRAEIVSEIRRYLNERDYTEIECPVLQPIYGGATARPFTTKHNALGQKFFLSISSELYLKRAMVGGFDRVYSISRCFRNEGISQEHNPEFTNVEFFSTCETYETMGIMTELLLHHLWKKFALRNLNSEIINPLVIDRRMGMPAADWPLSRKYISPDKKEYAQAWEMYINDMEIASGASDLNDPGEQESRMRQSEKKAGPDVYNQTINDIDYDPYDQNYIEALELGALPWAGVGIGIDRLCMLLLGKKNIRDVVMFNTLKDKI